MKLSIITINYNNILGLKKTIDSIRCQTFRDFEWIIIDGGSTDGSAELIRANSNILSYWCSEPDQGVYDAMNKGIRHAKGEWLSFMNSGDTFVDCNTLQNVFNEPIPSFAKFLYSNTLSKLPDGSLRLSKQNHLKGNIIHQSSIYKRDLHEKYGLYVVTNKIIISDLLFFLSIPPNYYYKVQTIIANFELGGISSTGTWAIKQKLCALCVYRKIKFCDVFSLYLFIRCKMFGRSIITSINILLNKWKQ